MQQHKCKGFHICRDEIQLLCKESMNEHEHPSQKQRKKWSLIRVNRLKSNQVATRESCTDKFVQWMRTTWINSYIFTWQISMQCDPHSMTKALTITLRVFWRSSCFLHLLESLPGMVCTAAQLYWCHVLLSLHTMQISWLKTLKV